MFQFGSLVAYALIASTIVGDILINIRSVNKQDKAISIGFWMMWIALFAYVPGKILYEFVSSQACQYWGNQKIICHLHDSEKLGNYLCYLTILFLSLCLLIKIIVWFFCKNLQLYDEIEIEIEYKDQENVELQELVEQPATAEQFGVLNNSKYFFQKVLDLIFSQKKAAVSFS